MRILEELWYGNIEPTEFTASSDREYQKALQKICQSEETLMASLTEEQKALFSQYTDCVNRFQSMETYYLFQNSFRLGARMMLEIMEE